MAPRRLGSGLLLLTMFGFLAWLGWTGAQLPDAMRAETQRAVRVAELRGTIAYLNESLTMSTRMAALTGDPSWIERYDEVRPQLDAAIAEAVALATPKVSAALARTTGEANADLIRTERAALARIAAGDRAGALSLLDSTEFDYLEATYAAGLEGFGQDLSSLAKFRATTLNDRAWMEALGLAITAIIVATGLFSLDGRARVRAARAQAARAARVDHLTGLTNQRCFQEELHRRLTGLRPDIGIALLLIDLDRFKRVNDLHGYPAGDQLLQRVAARLSAIAGDALIGRFGGDAFGLVLRGEASPDQAGLAAFAAMIAERVIAAMDQPIELAGGAMVRPGASIGLALAEGEGRDAKDLVHAAEVALYQAKADGRGCFRVFQPGMDASAAQQAALESELRQAIADDAIIPHFQPLVRLATGRVTGFEMLARWPHPIRGMIPPGEFVPLAEEIGVIGQMTDRLLRRACLVATTWPSDVTLACNISPLQLRDDSLPPMISAVLAETGFPAERLELEITESALVGDLEHARAILCELKTLGVRLALDDFGTGYSNLRQLQRLPFDTLKIDAGFVGAMGHDVGCRKIVIAVIGLGRSLGLATVAEGIEEPEIAAMLRELNCDVAQGWLFGRPVPGDAVSTLLLMGPPRPTTRTDVPLPSEPSAKPATLSLPAL